jgi:hypothetical protein
MEMYRKPQLAYEFGRSSLRGDERPPRRVEINTRERFFIKKIACKLISTL